MAPDECSSQITPKRNDAQIEGRKKNHPPTPSLLVRYQLVFFGKVARAADEDVLRKLTFCPGSLDLAANRFIRRARWQTPQRMGTMLVEGGSAYCWQHCRFTDRESGRQAFGGMLTTTPNTKVGSVTL